MIDVLAEMGLKMEDEAKKQSRPAEHQPNDDEPSVRDEPFENISDEPSEPPPPSVKEEKSVNAEPSVKEKKSKEKAKGEVIEPPPPSVTEE